MNRTDTKYNATIVYTDEHGTIYCHQLIQVIDDVVYRCNSLWTHNNGTELYHDDWVTHNVSTLRIGGEGSSYQMYYDGGQRYRDRLKNMFG